MCACRLLASHSPDKLRENCGEKSDRQTENEGDRERAARAEWHKKLIVDFLFFLSLSADVVAAAAVHVAVAGVAAVGAAAPTLLHLQLFMAAWVSNCSNSIPMGALGCIWRFWVAGCSE